MSRNNGLAGRLPRAVRTSAPTEVPTSAPTEVRTSAPKELRTPTPIRTTPVSVTVQLQPLEYRDLQRAVRVAQEKTGVVRVANAEVFRQLLGLLADDINAGGSELSERLIQRLAASGGSRRR